MANWDSKRIADAIAEIEDEKFVLPVIQRELVWTEEKMELLFDTLLKGDSFGGIIVIEEEKDKPPLFSYRPFIKDAKDGESNQSRIDSLPQNQLFVIDGQQRLQSFYIGLNGSFNGKILYFDLFSDYYNSEYEFKFENDETKLPKQSKDNLERPIKNHFWYPAKNLLIKLKEGRPNQVVKEIIETANINDDKEEECIRENVLSFSDSILNKLAIGISKVKVDKTLPEEKNRQRIVEMFKRLNDGGTRLLAFDLVAAKLKGYEWEMEGFLREMQEEYQNIGLDQDNLVKLIFLLQDNYDKEMAAIEKTDAEFAIHSRTKIEATLKALKDFLKYAKLYDYYKDSNRSFIPLFFIAYHLFHKNKDDNSIRNFFDNYETGNSDFVYIRIWLINSLLNGVFNSRGSGWVHKTCIRKILKLIKNYKGKPFPVDGLFNIYTNHPVTFTINYTKDDIDKLDKDFVFYLMYDLSSDSRENHKDHIMPKSILEKRGYPQFKINSIKNKQLLDPKTNCNAKNGKPFAQWINNPEYVKDRHMYMSRHLIPNDESLWHEDHFEDFIEKRAELILERILKYAEYNTENGRKLSFLPNEEIFRKKLFKTDKANCTIKYVDGTVKEYIWPAKDCNDDIRIRFFENSKDIIEAIFEVKGV
ncbi:MAG: DUF262 domain-containing protein [Fibromonadaceae bacterium]|jgi:hypothetical protein|nr:DUF262 domain-containing protein [Fibromonadaceae bacterium]